MMNQPSDPTIPAVDSQGRPLASGMLLVNLNIAIEEMLETDQPEQAIRLATVILRQLPRHLPTYQRLLRATWMLKRWEEGEDWGRRLLQADPGNALAWRAVARSVEQRGERARGHGIWQRAFEADPYDPEIRAGLSRTSLNDPDVLTLDLACLATLYLRGRHWRHAADVYRTLLRADPRRIDFQVNLLIALWQQGVSQDAYQLARHLTPDHPYLLMAWVALDALGDDNDKALARNPIGTLDPDGEFARRWLGSRQPERPVVLEVSTDEVGLLESLMPSDAPLHV